MDGTGTLLGDRGDTGLLDRARTVAGPGFNRWLLPPAALAIHLCIGMAYGFSVFWKPLQQAVGITAPVVCPAGYSVLSRAFSTSCDWLLPELAFTYTLFFVVLGSAAAIWGGWLERAGPRKAGVVAACCWCGGLLISAFGIYTHQLWIMWLGSGLIGGIGLGLGYISPVSTLIKWFPDRRGMATGMAIMGFGGGALVGAPLADYLMNHFKGSSGVGVWQTFVALAAIYAVFMFAGAFGYRVPPNNWSPEGWVKPAATGMVTARSVHLRDAHKTPQFWLIWTVLCLNVSAGIGVLAVASPMLQEIFGGGLVGRVGVTLSSLDASSKTAAATIAAGFVGLLSLFNIGGRFFWASFSDKIGRKATYAIFFALGIVLYAGAPWAASVGGQALFVGAFCIIVSMYGGGFATVPAYLADVFGTQYVGAIHGRLLTAWSTAGVLGPVVVTYITQTQRDAGMPPGAVYNRTLYILAGFLVVGFVANLLVRPVAEKWYIPAGATGATGAVSTGAVSTGAVSTATSSFGIGRGGVSLPAVLAWLCVGIPIAGGVYFTLLKSLVLFQ